MEIEFDPAKEAANVARHGVSLVLGALVIPAAVVTFEDTRRDYGEARFNAYGRIRGVAFVCTYTLRGEAYRIISVRRASRKERSAWLT